MVTVTEVDEPPFLWKIEVVSGIGALVIGVIAMVWPLETAAAVVVLWGIFIVIDGLGMGVLGMLKGTRGRAVLVVGAVIAVLVGLFAIVRPSVAAATVVWVLGVWFVLKGLFEGFQALASSSGSARWILLAGAVMTFALGVVFLWKPGGSVTALTFVLGLMTALRGVALVISGFRARQDTHHSSLGPAVV